MCFNFKQQYKKETAELICRLKNKNISNNKIADFMNENNFEIFGPENIWTEKLVLKIFFAYF